MDPDEVTAAILHLAAGMLSESELNKWIEPIWNKASRDPLPFEE
jgi:hypothetical protein